MELRELNEVKVCSSEEELIKITERIGDKIIFKGYREHEVILLVNALMNIDIIKSKIDLKKILEVRDRIEEDLKEYIEDLLRCSF